MGAVLTISSVADVRYLTAVARYTATQRMRKILCLHLGNKLCSVDEIAEVETRLEELRLFLKATTETLSHTKEVQRPSEQGSVGNALIHDWTTQSDNYTVVSFCAWARSLLHLYLHKAYVILYHPLMKMEDQGPWMSRRTRYVARLFSATCITSTNGSRANILLSTPEPSNTPKPSFASSLSSVRIHALSPSPGCTRVLINLYSNSRFC